jgi:hypothetical protein
MCRCFSDKLYWTDFESENGWNKMQERVRRRSIEAAMCR